MASQVLEIDEERLSKDSHYRLESLFAFLDFGSEDIRAIHEVSPYLVEQLPDIVDEIYEKLLTTDFTRRHFVHYRQHDYEGPVAESPEELTPDHEVIAFRKTRLVRYFTELFVADFDEATADFMDAVGKMHTTKVGSVSIQIPLMQMNMLLCYITDLFFQRILKLDIDEAKRARTLGAMNKLFWIQQSFITNQY